jgi:hypothetical protein
MFWLGSWLRGCVKQLMAKRQGGGTLAVGQEAEMTDAREALWKDVQQEASQELVESRNRTCLVPKSQTAPYSDA